MDRRLAAISEWWNCTGREKWGQLAQWAAQLYQRLSSKVGKWWKDLDLCFHARIPSLDRTLDLGLGVLAVWTAFLVFAGIGCLLGMAGPGGADDLPYAVSAAAQVCAALALGIIILLWDMRRTERVAGLLSGPRVAFWATGAGLGGTTLLGLLGSFPLVLVLLTALCVWLMVRAWRLLSFETRWMVKTMVLASITGLVLIAVRSAGFAGAVPVGLLGSIGTLVVLLASAIPELLSYVENGPRRAAESLEYQTRSLSDDRLTEIRTELRRMVGRVVQLEADKDPTKREESHRLLDAILTTEHKYSTLERFLKRFAAADDAGVPGVPWDLPTEVASVLADLIDIAEAVSPLTFSTLWSSFLEAAAHCRQTGDDSSVEIEQGLQNLLARTACAAELQLGGPNSWALAWQQTLGRPLWKIPRDHEEWEVDEGLQRKRKIISSLTASALTGHTEEGEPCIRVLKALIRTQLIWNPKQRDLQACVTFVTLQCALDRPAIAGEIIDGLREVIADRYDSNDRLAAKDLAAATAVGMLSCVWSWSGDPSVLEPLLGALLWGSEAELGKASERAALRLERATCLSYVPVYRLWRHLHHVQRGGGFYGCYFAPLVALRAYRAEFPDNLEALWIDANHLSPDGRDFMCRQLSKDGFVEWLTRDATKLLKDGPLAKWVPQDHSEQDVHERVQQVIERYQTLCGRA